MSSPSMTLAEVASRYNVSSKTIRRRIADGSLPAFRVGPRLIRVDVADVERLFRPIPTRQAS